MTNYVVRRLLQLPLILLFASVVVFSLMHLSPGDPVPVMLGDFYTPESEAALRHELGLDRPLPVQYLSWLSGLVRLDLGNSITTKQPVLWEILQRLPNTLLLAVMSMVWAVIVAIPVGIVAGVNQNSWVDYLTMGFALAGISIPHFTLAILLIMVLAVQLDLVPISGGPSVLDDVAGAARFFILPAFVLGSRPAGIMARMLRSSMVEVLHQDYIATAKSKGLAHLQVVLRHALKNAFIPTLTVFGISAAGVLGGSIVIESIFSIPGIGGYTIQALIARDYPVIQGISLVVAFIFILVNLATDIFYTFLDPRIRYE
jgi:peptide/nickel transport system permease protein